jgi:ubiquinone biosynthesis protein
VTADLDIVIRLATWLQRRTDWGRRLGILALAKGFAASLDEELDYTVELSNHAAVDADLDPRDGVVVPHAYRELSTSRLIVMERMSGTPVSRAAPLLATMDPSLRQEMAHRLLRAVLRQVLVTGVFHADLHQGNVLVDETGRIALLDLGAVGRLDSGSRDALALLLHAVERRDSVAATDAVLDLLDRPADLDDRAFERELGQLLQRFAGAGGGGSTGMFQALFSLVIRHHFAVPPQVAAALRALGALEGTLWSISPQVDLVAAARKEGRSVLASRFGPSEVAASPPATADQHDHRELRAGPVGGQRPRPRRRARPRLRHRHRPAGHDDPARRRVRARRHHSARLRHRAVHAADSSALHVPRCHVVLLRLRPGGASPRARFPPYRPRLTRLRRV